MSAEQPADGDLWLPPPEPPAPAGASPARSSPPPSSPQHGLLRQYRSALRWRSCAGQRGYSETGTPRARSGAASLSVSVVGEAAPAAPRQPGAAGAGRPWGVPRCCAAVGDAVWTAESDGRIVIRDPRSAAARQVLTLAGGPPREAASSPRSRADAAGCLLAVSDRVWVGTASGAVAIYCARSGRRDREQRRHIGAVHALAGPDAAGRVFSGGEDFKVGVWAAASENFLRLLHGHTLAVRCLALPPSLVASGGDDTTICLWQPESGALQQRLAGHSGDVLSLCAADGGSLWSASRDTTLRVWNCASGEVLAVHTVHRARVHTVRRIAAQRVLSASADGAAALWNAADATLLHEFPPDGACPATHAVEPLIRTTECLLWALHGDGTIRFWTAAAAGAEAAGHSGEAAALAAAVRQEQLRSARLAAALRSAKDFLGAERAKRGGSQPREDAPQVAALEARLRETESQLESERAARLASGVGELQESAVLRRCAAQLHAAEEEAARLRCALAAAEDGWEREREHLGALLLRERSEADTLRDRLRDTPARYEEALAAARKQMHRQTAVIRRLLPLSRSQGSAAGTAEDDDDEEARRGPSSSPLPPLGVDGGDWLDCEAGLLSPQDSRPAGRRPPLPDGGAEGAGDEDTEPPPQPPPPPAAPPPQHSSASAQTETWDEILAANRRAAEAAAGRVAAAHRMRQDQLRAHLALREEALQQLRERCASLEAAQQSPAGAAAEAADDLRSDSIDEVVSASPRGEGGSAADAGEAEGEAAASSHHSPPPHPPPAAPEDAEDVADFAQRSPDRELLQAELAAADERAGALERQLIAARAELEQQLAAPPLPPSPRAVAAAAAAAATACPPGAELPGLEELAEQQARWHRLLAGTRHLSPPRHSPEDPGAAREQLLLQRLQEQEQEIMALRAAAAGGGGSDGGPSEGGVLQQVHILLGSEGGTESPAPLSADDSRFSPSPHRAPQAAAGEAELLRCIESQEAQLARVAADLLAAAEVEEAAGRQRLAHEEELQRAAAPRPQRAAPAPTPQAAAGVPFVPADSLCELAAPRGEVARLCGALTAAAGVEEEAARLRIAEEEELYRRLHVMSKFADEAVLRRLLRCEDAEEEEECAAEVGPAAGGSAAPAGAAAAPAAAAAGPEAEGAPAAGGAQPAPLQGSYEDHLLARLRVQDEELQRLRARLGAAAPARRAGAHSRRTSGGTAEADELEQPRPSPPPPPPPPPPRSATAALRPAVAASSGEAVAAAEELEDPGGSGGSSTAAGSQGPTEELRWWQTQLTLAVGAEETAVRTRLEADWAQGHREMAAAAAQPLPPPAAAAPPQLGLGETPTSPRAPPAASPPPPAASAASAASAGAPRGPGAGWQVEALAVPEEFEGEQEELLQRMRAQAADLQWWQQQAVRAVEAEEQAARGRLADDWHRERDEMERRLAAAVAAARPEIATQYYSAPPTASDAAPPTASDAAPPTASDAASLPPLPAGAGACQLSPLSARAALTAAEAAAEPLAVPEEYDGEQDDLGRTVLAQAAELRWWQGQLALALTAEEEAVRGRVADAEAGQWAELQRSAAAALPQAPAAALSADECEEEVSEREEPETEEDATPLLRSPPPGAPEGGGPAGGPAQQRADLELRLQGAAEQEERARERVADQEQLLRQLLQQEGHRAAHTLEEQELARRRLDWQEAQLCRLADELAAAQRGEQEAMAQRLEWQDAELRRLAGQLAALGEAPAPPAAPSRGSQSAPSSHAPEELSPHREPGASAGQQAERPAEGPAEQHADPELLSRLAAQEEAMAAMWARLLGAVLGEEHAARQRVADEAYFLFRILAQDWSQQLQPAALPAGSDELCEADEGEWDDEGASEHAAAQAAEARAVVEAHGEELQRLREQLIGVISAAEASERNRTQDAEDVRRRFIRQERALSGPGSGPPREAGVQAAAEAEALQELEHPVRAVSSPAARAPPELRSFQHAVLRSPSGDEQLREFEHPVIAVPDVLLQAEAELRGRLDAQQAELDDALRRQAAEAAERRRVRAEAAAPLAELRRLGTQLASVTQQAEGAARERVASEEALARAAVVHEAELGELADWAAEADEQREALRSAAAAQARHQAEAGRRAQRMLLERDAELAALRAAQAEAGIEYVERLRVLEARSATDQRDKETYALQLRRREAELAGLREAAQAAERRAEAARAEAAAGAGEMERQYRAAVEERDGALAAVRSAAAAGLRECERRMAELQEREREQRAAVRERDLLLAELGEQAAAVRLGALGRARDLEEGAAEALRVADALRRELGERDAEIAELRAAAAAHALRLAQQATPAASPQRPASAAGPPGLAPSGASGSPGRGPSTGGSPPPPSEPAPPSRPSPPPPRRAGAWAAQAPALHPGAPHPPTGHCRGTSPPPPRGAAAPAQMRSPPRPAPVIAPRSPVRSPARPGASGRRDFAAELGAELAVLREQVNEARRRAETANGVAFGARAAALELLAKVAERPSAPPLPRRPRAQPPPPEPPSAAPAERPPSPERASGASSESPPPEESSTEAPAPAEACPSPPPATDDADSYHGSSTHPPPEQRPPPEEEPQPEEEPPPEEVPGSDAGRSAAEGGPEGSSATAEGRAGDTAQGAGQDQGGAEEEKEEGEEEDEEAKDEAEEEEAEEEPAGVREGSAESQDAHSEEREDLSEKDPEIPAHEEGQQQEQDEGERPSMEGERDDEAEDSEQEHDREDEVAGGDEPPGGELGAADGVTDEEGAEPEAAPAAVEEERREEEGAAGAQGVPESGEGVVAADPSGEGEDGSSAQQEEGDTAEAPEEEHPQRGASPTPSSAGEAGGEPPPDAAEDRSSSTAAAGGGQEEERATPEADPAEGAAAEQEADRLGAAGGPESGRSSHSGEAAPRPPLATPPRPRDSAAPGSSSPRPHRVPIFRGPPQQHRRQPLVPPGPPPGPPGPSRPVVPTSRPPVGAVVRLAGMGQCGSRRWAPGAWALVAAHQGADCCALRLDSGDGPPAYAHDVPPQAISAAVMPPAELVVAAPRMPAASGVYALVPGALCNHLPVWAASGGRRIESNHFGQWMLGDEADLREGTGWVVSATPHRGLMPHDPALAWQSFAAPDEPWEDDSSLRVMLRSAAEAEAAAAGIYLPYRAHADPALARASPQLATGPTAPLRPSPRRPPQRPPQQPRRRLGPAEQAAAAARALAEIDARAAAEQRAKALRRQQWLEGAEQSAQRRRASPRRVVARTAGYQP